MKPQQTFAFASTPTRPKRPPFWTSSRSDRNQGRELAHSLKLGEDDGGSNDCQETVRKLDHQEG